MDGDGTYVSCSPWRRCLGGLKHVRVVACWLAGWAIVMSSSLGGAISRSVALACSFFSAASVLASEACALLGEQIGRDSEC
jgi:hypothetical protein